MNGPDEQPAGRRASSDTPGGRHRAGDVPGDPEVPDGWLTERTRILTEGNDVLARAAQARAANDRDEAGRLAERADALRDRYVALLPEHTVARCPHTGELVRWPLDDVDLDGWYWKYESPALRLPAVPATWLAMAGAVALRTPVAAAPFLCRPGPGAPFVVPRILGGPDVRAVLRELPIGPHLGWAVTYFGTAPAGKHLVNLWGSGSCPLTDGEGRWRGWDEVTPWSPDHDFDLAPWLESGKLLWIAPGDRSSRLRTGVEGCPYLGIDGPHDMPFIENGEVRYPAPLPAAARDLHLD